MLAFAAYYDALDQGVALGGTEFLDQRLDQFRAEGVTCLGAVEYQGGDAVFHRALDKVGHGCDSSGGDNRATVVQYHHIAFGDFGAEADHFTILPELGNDGLAWVDRCGEA
ncbi:hypothetical protein D3C85_1381860 [compost metagenome]